MLTCSYHNMRHSQGHRTILEATDMSSTWTVVMWHGCMHEHMHHVYVPTQPDAYRHISS